jgi:hypothetical protein
MPMSSFMLAAMKSPFFYVIYHVVSKPLPDRLASEPESHRAY